MPEASGLQHVLGPDLQVAHLDEYFGVWAIEERRFRAAVERIRGMDLRAHVIVQKEKQPEAADRRFGYAVTRGIAIIDAIGPLMKYPSSLEGGTSTVQLRRQIRNAADDPEIEGILLRCDSPGGTVSGTQDAAEDVAAAAKKKPVYGYAEDLCASAMYWIFSQCTKCFCNPTALVGSIGTFMIVDDWSGAYEQAGVKVHVLRAGEFKGAGVPGTEVTDEQLAEWQRTVDALNGHFLSGVAAGRNMKPSAVKELADGRVHVGAEAKKLGLVDGVQTLDATLEQLTKRRSSKGAKSMTVETKSGDDQATETKTTQTTPPATPAAQQPATLEQLETACPGAEGDFLLAQLKAKATVGQATAAYMKHLQEANEAKAKQLTELQQSAGGKKRGVPPLGDGGKSAAADTQGFDGDAVAEVRSRVEKKVAGGMSRKKAIAAVLKSDHDLHRAYLLATNSGAKKQALINERFDD